MIDSKTKAIMQSIVGGADIYNYSDAVTLRALEKVYPEFIDIVDAQGYTGDGTDQIPYFGAILTGAGKAFLQQNH